MVMQKKWSAAVVAAMCVGTAAQVFASVYFDEYRNYNTTSDGFVSYDNEGEDDASIAFQSFSGGEWSGFTLTNGESIAFTTGRADSSNMSMGVRGYVDSSPLNSRFSDCKMDVGASNFIAVQPGNSGLAPGSTTRLRMNLRLDGSLYTEARSYPSTGWAHAELRADLTIRDPNNRIDTGEGWYVPTLVGFGADVECEAYDVNANYWDHSGYTTWNEYWTLSTNVQEEIGNDDWFEEEHTGESMLYSIGHHFDTGLRQVEFDVIVGHTLELEGWMYTYVNANHDALASCDFYNTFSFSFEPMVAGVQLTLVPEPTSLALAMICGLGLLRRVRA